ncbi:MAG: hypothetical protein RB191_00585 [Terriglobia bacterium]|nr:hypothetical protein [Terriglobia bacterium]
MATINDRPSASTRPHKPSPTPSPKGRPASDATGINVDQRGPIDPRMPSAPPA